MGEITIGIEATAKTERGCLKKIRSVLEKMEQKKQEPEKKKKK